MQKAEQIEGRHSAQSVHLRTHKLHQPAPTSPWMSSWKNSSLASGRPPGSLPAARALKAARARSASGRCSQAAGRGEGRGQGGAGGSMEQGLRCSNGCDSSPAGQGAVHSAPVMSQAVAWMRQP